MCQARFHFGVLYIGLELLSVFMSLHFPISFFLSSLLFFFCSVSFASFTFSHACISDMQASCINNAVSLPLESLTLIAPNNRFVVCDRARAIDVFRKRMRCGRGCERNLIKFLLYLDGMSRGLRETRKCFDGFCSVSWAETMGRATLRILT